MSFIKDNIIGVGSSVKNNKIIKAGGGHFEVGTTLTVVGVSDRGYAVQDGDGNQAIETGWDFELIPERTDKEWESFGYETDKPCEVCGAVDDCKAEPRFGYVICRKHSRMSPVEVSKVRDAQILSKEDVINNVKELSAKADRDAKICEKVPYDLGIYTGQEEAYEKVLELLSKMK